MTEKLQCPIREWKSREHLEHLAVGDVAPFRNNTSHLDRDFNGLYDGKNNGKYVVYARAGQDQKTIYTWFLNNRGFISEGRFAFSQPGIAGLSQVTEEVDFENYQALNDALEKKGL